MEEVPDGGGAGEESLQWARKNQSVGNITSPAGKVEGKKNTKKTTAAGEERGMCGCKKRWADRWSCYCVKGDWPEVVAFCGRLRKFCDAIKTVLWRGWGSFAPLLMQVPIVRSQFRVAVKISFISLWRKCCLAAQALSYTS